MPSKQRLLPPIFILLLVALTGAGCASVRAGAKGALPPAPSAGSSQQKVVTPASLDSRLDAAEVDEAIHGARSLFELGRQHYQTGDMTEARSDFDRAIEKVTSFPNGARGDARLADAYADLLSEIQDIETASYQTGSGLSPATEPPPLEELDEIVPEITPEQAAQDLELVENAAIPTDPPVIFNDKVLAWIDIYRGRMHDRFQEGLTRSGRYIDMLRRIFREEGLPEDLAYMAHVESAYKPNAYSRARAKGVWQFIVGTGTRYGLRRDWWIDERSDPELATRAAAAYLKDLYAMFGDWYLAMAAYNAGEWKILRAMERTGQRDFWGIAATSQIKLETKNYVPAILAAIVISKNPEKFGFSSDKEPPVTYDAVAIDSATDLRVIARLSGASLEELKRLNPALARLQTPPNYPDFEVHLPSGSGERFATGFGQLARSERIPWQSHTVSKGDTLAALSRRYGVSVAQIRDANGLVPTERLRSGRSLQIPTYVAPAAGRHGDSARAAKTSGTKTVGSRQVYKVHKGDTLASIARRYKTTVSALQSWNRLSANDTLRSGDRLVIYYGREEEPPRPAQAVASIAAPEGKDPLGSPADTAAPRDSPPSMQSPQKPSPPQATYRVRTGDTLFKIAKQLSTTVDRICRLNKLSAGDPLIPGTLLTIER